MSASEQPVAQDAHGGAMLPLEALAEQVARRQAAGERAVFTNGVFDLLHLGHIQYLQRARALGDFLIVGVNSDASTRRLKGSRRPLAPEDERAQLLAALTAVEYVTIFGEDTAERLLATLQPAIYVKGGDYASAEAQDQARDTYLSPDALRAIVAGQRPDDAALAGLADLAALPQRLPEARAVAEYGGALALLAYLPGHSTTALIERIVARYGPLANDAGAASQS